MLNAPICPVCQIHSTTSTAASRKSSLWFRYLGVHISNDHTWSCNSHQGLYLLRRLRPAGLTSSDLTSFYKCVVESVLCYSITVCHGRCSAAEKAALQRGVKAAQLTFGCSLTTTTENIHLSMEEKGDLHHKGPHPPYTLTIYSSSFRQETDEH